MASTNRRTTIVEAAWRAIARSGVRSLRVEDVASDAGVSVGLIYYHFKDRTGLLQATMEYANQMTPVPAGADIEGTGRERLTATLLADFGGSELSRDNAVVWHELLAAAIFEEGVRPQVQATLREWRTSITSAIRQGQQDGSIRPDLDPLAATAALAALADGLLSHVVVESLSWSSAAETLRDAVERLCAPAPAHDPSRV
jgi:AcrR family transcriptional regulator